MILITYYKPWVWRREATSIDSNVFSYVHKSVRYKSRLIERHVSNQKKISGQFELIILNVLNCNRLDAILDWRLAKGARVGRWATRTAPWATRRLPTSSRPGTLPSPRRRATGWARLRHRWAVRELWRWESDSVASVQVPIQGMSSQYVMYFRLELQLFSAGWAII